MNPSDTLTVPPHVMARKTGDETVILDLASGQYYGLDPVGARIWDCLADGLSLAQTSQALLEEFEVQPEQLAADLQSLVHTLLERQLLQAGA